MLKYYYNRKYDTVCIYGGPEKDRKEGKNMAESSFIGGYAVIGIRPTIDGRRGPI